MSTDNKEKDLTADFIFQLDAHIDENTMVSYGDRSSIIDFVKKYMHRMDLMITSKDR